MPVYAVVRWYWGSGGTGHPRRCILSVWAVALVSFGPYLTVGSSRYLTVGSSQYVVMRKSSRFRSTGVIAGKPDSTAEGEGFPIPLVSRPGRRSHEANHLSGGFTAGQRVLDSVG